MSNFENIKSKFLKKIKEAFKEKEPFDPSSIDDPLASQISWKPNRKGGYNFTTYKLNESVSGRLILEKTTFMKVFPLIVFIPISFGFFVAFSVREIEFISPIDLAGIGLGAFIILFYLLFKYNDRKYVFDKAYRYFYRNKFNPYQPVEEFNEKIQKLSSIHAIQIISERIKTKNSSYLSYEINLVLKDKSRITIIDHGKKERIWEQADNIAKFLKVPVWRGF